MGYQFAHPHRRRSQMSHFAARHLGKILAAAPLSVAGHAFLAKPLSQNLLECQASIETRFQERASSIWPTKGALNWHSPCGNAVQGDPVPASAAVESYLVLPAP